MSAELAAQLRDVGKQYVKYEDTPTLLTGVIRLPRRGKRARLWALRHVDLEVARGDAVGVIGRNGAGKSTMLAILAGVTAPSEGTVSVRGRLAPLLKLGVGFHTELTGRENVYVNCMMLGMGRTQVDEAFDEIVDFAEIEEFIDTPVKFYSSGMQVRLGFASAVAARPDVLIVDEVLSVGDIGFQVKSFDRMREMREHGTTLLVVSHNLDAIRRTCEQVMVLEKGSSVFHGPTDEAISVYHETLRGTWLAEGDAAMSVVDLELTDAEGRTTANVPSGGEVVLRCTARCQSDAEDVGFAFSLGEETGRIVYSDNTFESLVDRLSAGTEVTWEARMRVPLATGTYVVRGGVRWGRGQHEWAAGPAKGFYVAGRPSVGGSVDLEAGIRLVQEAQVDGTPTEDHI